MKKNNYLPVLLCLSILIQCLLLPVSATAVTPSDPSENSFSEALK